eukprot:138935_1
MAEQLETEGKVEAKEDKQNSMDILTDYFLQNDVPSTVRKAFNSIRNNQTASSNCLKKEKIRKEIEETFNKYQLRLEERKKELLNELNNMNENEIYSNITTNKHNTLTYISNLGKKNVLEILSVDHSCNKIGIYFNFDKKQLSEYLNTEKWNSNRLQIRHLRTNYVGWIIVWNNKNGGSKWILDKEGKMDGQSGYWKVGDFIQFIQ